MTGIVPDDRGFALPAVILLVALLTVLLTSGLTRARTERQLADASDDFAAAMAIAESGLQTYYGTVTAPPGDGDSTRINVTGGYANVVVHLVQRPPDTTQPLLYLVRSTGIVINPAAGPIPQSRRTAAQFAEWEYGYMLRRAVLTAPNGLQHRSRNSDPARLEVNGADLCGVSPPIPGIRAKTINWGGPPDPDTIIVGTPRMIEGGTADSIAAQTRIGWTAAWGNGLIPDYATFQNGSTTYPIQRVAGTLTLTGTNAGSGLLLVQDDLEITGTSFTFNGIILVGGLIQFWADYNRVNGLVISGLNGSTSTSATRTGSGPPDNRRDTHLYYDTCRVDSTLAALSGFVPVRNAWFDTWATF